MNFCQRLANTLYTASENIFMHLHYDHRQEAVYNNHFADPKPKLEDLRKSLPLVLLNSHFSMSYPRPNLPNLVDIGGFHINRNRKSLPKDLQEFLDTAPNGVIYFSMGSTLKGADLPVEKRDALLRVFGRLPVRVMWKWEDDALPGKPENVLIRKWFPQDDILAHPKVRFFITHGGLLSTMEATYHGVPVLGIPIFGDQGMNMGKTQAAGYGITIEFTNLTEQSISWAINEMLTNTKYSERAKTISARFRDQPEDPMSRAVYWIEYVARHQGAEHLISGGQELNFIQYHNLDVFGFLLLIPFLVIISITTSLSAILLNSHFSMSYPRPNLPNYIEIGGFHINKKSKPLPKDLEEFLDTAPNGVIYFSMGSNLKSADLPVEKRDALLRVFGRLPVRVLWKWEDDALPGKPENVLIRKWFPQDDILAHPKVRFFITHGGLLSTMEATYHGVPVLGIPIFGDQGMNMGKTQAAGYGITIEFTNLTEQSISWAINEMLTNTKYSERAKTISARFRDQPEDPMSRAVYWIEYVARHQGAKHLISGGQELNFIQYHNLDVFALLLLIPVLIILGIRLLCKKLCMKSSRKDLKKKYN
uniref:Putative udp-glucoronosyl and udp-glucosyl transferase n=1 Tax=Lutzomyia longipalpis TaxID=7200 RepID=A0A1B0CEV9_LUTLO